MTLPSIAHPEELFIGGAWRAPASKAVASVISPVTEEVIARVPLGSPEDIDLAVASARHAFDDGPWSQMGPHDRADLLDALGTAVGKRATESTTLLVAEIGALTGSAQWSMNMTASAYPFYAGLCRDMWFSQDRDRLDGGRSSVLREPVGVVAAIMPWNGPPVSTAKKLGAALAAGCTVVVKPPPEAPLNMYLLAEAIEEVGFPEGVISIVAGGSDTGERLVRHPHVDKVTFTGGIEVGRKIASWCASDLKRYTLELGGKSAGIILDDMDLDEVVPRLAGLCTTNAGQACLLLSRLLVSRTRYDEFVAKLASAFRAVRVGDPADPETQMGPLATRTQLERIQYYIKVGLEEDGATLASGGNVPNGCTRGYFIEPTLFANVEPSMRIAQEEVYGPVISAIAYDNIDHAMEIANSTVYGLSSTLFTNDHDLALSLVPRLRSGTVNVNTFAFDLGVPFGGMKQSGVGREGGLEGVERFFEVKTVSYPV